MNTIAKVSVAGALALGYVSANATVVVPTSSGPSGTDVMLFAEVVSGTTILGSYAGDTQVAVGTTLTSSNLKDSTSSDSALASLISLGTSSGNTIEWGIMGGKFTLVGNPNAGDIYLTTLPSGASSLSGTIGTNLGSWSTGLQNTLQVVKSNAGTANSVFATTVAAGGIWDGTLATTATSNASNWFNNGASNVITGLGTATLYLVTSGASAATNTVAAEPGILTLSATGLTYTTAAPVPLPAAIWLLGGGLLGLFGIGRRKSATA
jgi:hypothetical protein